MMMGVNAMPSDKNWISVRLPPNLAERLEKYILAVANKNGSIPYGIRSRIVLESIEQWLEQHENDLGHFEF